MSDTLMWLFSRCVASSSKLEMLARQAMEVQPIEEQRRKLESEQVGIHSVPFFFFGNRIPPRRPREEGKVHKRVNLGKIST